MDTGFGKIDAMLKGLRPPLLTQVKEYVFYS